MLPREKTLKYGISYLTNNELLALVLKTGPKGSNVLQLAEELIEKANGDEETMDLDEDFLKSMEHGMPPMSGLGFGIDRFIMLIYDLPNIRDTVLFPIMK